MTGETVFVSSTGETVSHPQDGNTHGNASISMMLYLKTHGRKAPFIKAVFGWGFAFVLLVATNIALVMQGGKLSELATAFLVGLAILYHYLLEPFWTQTCRKKSESENGKDDEAEGEGEAQDEAEAETENTAPAAVAAEKETVIVNVITDEEVATVTTTANADSNTTNDDNTGKKKELSETEESVDSDDSTAPTKQPPVKRPRLLFLDNVKVFLTALVVTHHITQGFGADRADSFYLVVGLGAPYTNSSDVVRLVMRIFVTINQAYFMPLFFFIVPTFVPAAWKNMVSTSLRLANDIVWYGRD